MAVFDFDANTVEPEAEFAPLPAGEYLMHVKASEVKDTKAGTGQYLQLTLEVLDGQAKGRIVFDNINIKNPNQVAVQIGQQHLSALCRAVGVMQINDSSQLHNKPVLVRLSVRPAQGNYDASNDVKGFKSSTAAPVQQQAEQKQANAPWS